MTNRPLRVLVIDDDEDHAEALLDSLAVQGHECRMAGSGRAGVERMEKESFDVVLTDLVMHDISGMEVLKEARRLQPEAVVLVITGHGSIETAVDAMRLGAADYITKPVNIAELRMRLAKAVEGGELRRTNRELRRQLEERYGFEGIVGQSPAMRRVFDILRQVSDTNATVLIQGESGTGKELVARAIHANSARKEAPLVAVNCAALSEGLIESELFGHVRGAFTGAIAHNEGRIVHADGGTLFLDEVGDMPPATQAKLLRVLETREVQPVGGQTPRKVDVRLVAATNRDLRGLVAKGAFREDLLFRLQVVTIDMPPLRERAGDVPLLIDHLLSELAQRHGRPVRGISPEARAALMRYEWPGNVRELRNALENMVLLSRGKVLQLEDVPESVREGAEHVRKSSGFELAGHSLAEVERALIQSNLELAGGNREKAAKILGMGERTLYRKLKTYGLS